jgi:hypothetical protein
VENVELCCTVAVQLCTVQPTFLVSSVTEVMSLRIPKLSFSRVLFKCYLWFFSVPTSSRTLSKRHHVPKESNVWIFV